MSGTVAPTVFILGLSSDIGRELGTRYQRDGYRVYGTYRQATWQSPRACAS
jgi:NAD(P)-dependent dehydrogenase (short-subunit alcohol dehydrogenase family)